MCIFSTLLLFWPFSQLRTQTFVCHGLLVGWVKFCAFFGETVALQPLQFFLYRFLNCATSITEDLATHERIQAGLKAFFNANCYFGLAHNGTQKV
jgi:hypothetical protein